MAICQVCTKTKQYGHNVSHSHRVTNRVFNVNVNKKRVYVNGEITLVKICGKCLKRVKKYGKIKAKDDAVLAQGTITLVNWQKVAKEKIEAKKRSAAGADKNKPKPIKTTPKESKAEEISIEDLVGKNNSA